MLCPRELSIQPACKQTFLNSRVTAGPREMKSCRDWGFHSSASGCYFRTLLIWLLSPKQIFLGLFWSNSKWNDPLVSVLTVPCPLVWIWLIKQNNFLLHSKQSVQCILHDLSEVSAHSDLLFLNLYLPWKICQKYGMVWILIAVSIPSSHFLFINGENNLKCSYLSILLHKQQSGSGWVSRRHSPSISQS